MEDQLSPSEKRILPELPTAKMFWLLSDRIVVVVVVVVVDKTEEIVELVDKPVDDEEEVAIDEVVEEDELVNTILVVVELIVEEIVVTPDIVYFRTVLNKAVKSVQCSEMFRRYYVSVFEPEIEYVSHQKQR